MELKTGMTLKQSIVVTHEMTAAALKSGELEVFSTPYMIALMENTALTCVAPYLDEGFGTVGTLVNVQHVAATPVGMEVTCEAELIEIDRRRLVFHVKAMDGAGIIGEGTHERFIIDSRRFMERAEQKKSV